MDEVVLACMGIGIAPLGECLASDCLDDLADLAGDVHDHAAWSAPYDPRRLAESEGIALACGDMDALLVDRALYVGAECQREDGLRVAHALAGVLLLRAGRYTELRAWALAAELLVPEWSMGGGGQAHQHAPLWLLSLRGRLVRAA